MSETLDYLQIYARYPFALRRFLRDPLTPEDARRIVRDRLARREENFLRLVERVIYRHPRSPYLALLNFAGCELGDLRASVKHEGVEQTLHQLRREGVYVSFEEFKRRKPLVRHGKEIPLRATDFDNPILRGSWYAETGGSSGPPTRAAHHLDHIAAFTPCQMLTLAAHGVLDAPAAFWRGILPDNSGLSNLFRWARMGRPVERWFSHIHWRSSKYGLKYVLATYYLAMGLRLMGARVPLPEYVPLDQAIVVAQWVHDTLNRKQGCLLAVQVSRALRVALCAQEQGWDLTGATFMIAGEPPTPAKVREIERTGARYFPTYGSEVGRLAMGCAQPASVNELHLLHDMCALITFPHAVAGFDVTVPAFHITSLLLTTPRVMLNVEVDDYGIVEERKCGCELEACGYTTHLSDIHSYSKLTGEGVTLIGSEMVHILENVLPARFGGSPLDYQLLEEEDGQGLTRLYLIVSPRIALVDEQAVIDCVLASLGESSPAAEAARTVWKQAGTLRVRRMEPVWTARGKLMPLHLQRG